MHGGVAGYRVPRAAGKLGTEPRTVRLAGCGDSLLHPRLTDQRVAPGREQADAVAAREYLVEVLVKLVEPHVLVDVLADVVGRLDVERQADHDPERSKRHDGPGEVVSAALDRDQLTIGRDHLDRGHRGGEVAGRVARAVRAGRAGSGD